jgi:hypothetical protein
MVTYVMRNGELVEKRPENSNDAPYVISDEIPPLVNHADGRMYTSKHKFREATKAAGCVEIGNEEAVRRRKPVLMDRRQRREDIRRAISDLKEGRAPSIRQIIEMNKGD